MKTKLTKTDIGYKAVRKDGRIVEITKSENKSWNVYAMIDGSRNYVYTYDTLSEAREVVEEVCLDYFKFETY